MRADLELPWGAFKTNCLDTGLYQWLYFDRGDTYIIFAKQNIFTVICKINTIGDTADKADFETNYLPGANKRLVSEVVTQLEKDDKKLALVSIEGNFSGDVCELELEIPGTFGEVGLFVKEGYAFSDVFAWGLRVEKVALVDKSFLYAGILYPAEPEPGVAWIDVMPSGVVLGDYCEAGGVPADNKGWRFWNEEGGQGGVDIDNLAGYGELLAGCFLQIKFTKPTGSAPTKIAVNIQCGVPSV